MRLRRLEKIEGVEGVVEKIEGVVEEEQTKVSNENRMKGNWEKIGVYGAGEEGGVPVERQKRGIFFRDNVALARSLFLPFRFQPTNLLAFSFKTISYFLEDAIKSFLLITPKLFCLTLISSPLPRAV